MELTWKCHVCGEVRPDVFISVCAKDMSKEYGLPTGTFKQNVRYCNDNAECAQKALTKTLIAGKEVQGET